MISRLEFEGVRCFSTPQCGTVRPLTLLVGENSAGKSTFLALFNAAAKFGGFPWGPRSLFNDPPFLLGAFEQIATNSGGKNIKSFSLGYVLGERQNLQRPLGSMRVFFRASKGQPVAHQVLLSIGTVSIGLKNASSGVKVAIQAAQRSDSYTAPSFLTTQDWEVVLSRLTNFHDGILTAPELTALRKFLDGNRMREVYALAPVRTTPQRTYDPVGDTPSPEGAHVPMFLAELSREASLRWQSIRRDLASFGSASGLFENIDIVRKGSNEGDPFQIAIGTGGPSVNLVDVGYGVSQVLPILVDALRPRAPRSTFLLQQPEVHLHPRAQAELGTFFARRVRKGTNFIVETHSDYLLDRVRLEVRRRKLRAEEVSILYFERGKHGARIHNLSLDGHGNILGAPPSYREFFLREERHLLDVE